MAIYLFLKVCMNVVTHTNVSQKCLYILISSLLTRGMIGLKRCWCIAASNSCFARQTSSDLQETDRQTVTHHHLTAQNAFSDWEKRLTKQLRTWHSPQTCPATGPAPWPAPTPGSGPATAPTSGPLYVLLRCCSQNTLKNVFILKYLKVPLITFQSINTILFYRCPLVTLPRLG